jgi:hypothetical protein
MKKSSSSPVTLVSGEVAGKVGAIVLPLVAVALDDDPVENTHSLIESNFTRWLSATLSLVITELQQFGKMSAD